ncbi:MAG TPA: response regulator [Cryomorphaceae bacterium]|nr:response regulator [Cryomorphaceae bacterium]
MNGLANKFTGKRKKRICIVDDDEMLSMMLEDHLAKNPSYFIETFPTGEDFLKILEDEETPDIIILDFNLDSIQPQAMNGLQVLKKIKSHDRRIKVIMYSSQEQYGKALQTISTGAVEYIIKDNGAFQRIDSLIKSM